MKPSIGAWWILSLSIAQLSGATLDTHDAAATPNEPLAQQGDVGEDIIDLDSAAAETPDSGASNNIGEKVTERLKAENREEMKVNHREGSTHRTASVTSDDGRTTETTDEAENEEMADGGIRDGEQTIGKSKSDHSGAMGEAWGEEVAKLAHAREASNKGEGVRDASDHHASSAGTEQAISSTIGGSPVVDAKKEEATSATIQQETSEPAHVPEAKNSTTDTEEKKLANANAREASNNGEGVRDASDHHAPSAGTEQAISSTIGGSPAVDAKKEKATSATIQQETSDVPAAKNSVTDTEEKKLASANDDVVTTAEDEVSTNTEPDADPVLDARNEMIQAKEQETRQEEAIDVEERASYPGEEAHEEGVIDSTEKEVKEQGTINAKEDESQEGAIDLEEKKETHQERAPDADAGQPARAATAANITNHSSTNTKAEGKDVSEDDGAKPSEMSDPKPGATAESSQTVSEQEEDPAAGDPDENPSESETGGARERVTRTSLENDPGQPQTSESSIKENPDASPSVDTNTRSKFPLDSTTPGDPPEPPTPKKGSLAEFFQKVNKDPTKDAVMDFVAKTAGNTEDESEHKPPPAAKEEDASEYGYTTVWGAKRTFQLDKPLLDELFERSSTVVTETGSASESDSSSTNAVPKALDATKNVETVDNATQLPKSVNTEFVEGLDDIDKFLEEVDPPDELDVGAAGSSMQEVLIGQGARIVLKRALMVLSRIRSSLHVARIKEFWSSRRNEEGQFALMKREEMERTLKQMRILVKGGLTNLQEFWEGLFDDDDDDLRFEMDLQQEESKLDSIRQRLLRQETEMPDPMETFKKQERPA